MKFDPIIFAKSVTDETRQKITVKSALKEPTTEKALQFINQ